MCSAGISKVYQTWVYSILRLARSLFTLQLLWLHLPASPWKNKLNSVIEKGIFYIKAALKIGGNLSITHKLLLK